MSFGKIEQPLVIDPLDEKKLSLSGLAFSIEYQKVADARDDAALLDDRTPLIADGLYLTPAGSSKFATADLIGVYFEVYAPISPGVDIAVELRAFDAKGAPKFDTGMLLVKRQEGRSSSPFAIAIPPSTLEPGTYKVEVTALDSLNHKFQRTASVEVR